jgi:hypothetical protein
VPSDVGAAAFNSNVRFYGNNLPLDE